MLPRSRLVLCGTSFRRRSGRRQGCTPGFQATSCRESGHCALRDSVQTARLRPFAKASCLVQVMLPGQLGEDSVEAEVLPQKRRSTFGSRARCSRGLLSPAGFRKEMLRAPWASVAAPQCSTKAVQKEDRFSGFLRAAPAKDPAGLGRLPTRGIRRRRHGNGSAVCPGPTGPSAAWEDVFGRTHEYFRAAPVF